MIKKGDRVKFISDTTTGTVSSINGNIANVTIEDGFDIPALLSDLVVVEEKTEKEAIEKMGLGGGSPLGGNVKKESKKESKKEKKLTGKSYSRYGRISLIADYEDEEPLDMDTLKKNYHKTITTEQDRYKAKNIELSPLELAEYEIKLCFVPDNPVKPHESNKWSLFVVNDSSYDILFSISKCHDGYVNNLGYGILDKNSKKEISEFKKNILTENIKLLINLILFKPTNYIPQPIEDFVMEIHPLKFTRYGSYTESEYFDVKTLIYTIASSKEKEQLEKLITPKIEDVKTAKLPVNSGKYKNNEPEITDLHAEEILGSTKNMTPGEIIKAQLSRFEIALDLAMRNNRGGRIVFIHGVGKGKLKYEMEKLIKRKYPRLKYQDASFKEYGYGAMMIFL